MEMPYRIIATTALCGRAARRLKTLDFLSKGRVDIPRHYKFEICKLISYCFNMFADDFKTDDDFRQLECAAHEVNHQQWKLSPAEPPKKPEKGAIEIKGPWMEIDLRKVLVLYLGYALINYFFF
jgi:hypothetical protein